LPVALVRGWHTHGMLDAVPIPAKNSSMPVGVWNMDHTGYATSYSSEHVGPFGLPKNTWQVFNLHPLFMILAFVTLYSQAALHFRLLPFDHETCKLIHMGTQTLGLLFACLGLAVVVKFKDVVKAHEWYNTHDYVGISVFSLFCAQWLCGFVSFFLPKLSKEAREAYHPWHVFAGVTILIGAAVAVCTGLAGYSWIFDHGPKPAPWHAQFRLPGLIALSVFVAVGTVLFHHGPLGRRTVSSSSVNDPLIGGGSSSEAVDRRPTTTNVRQAAAQYQALHAS